MGTSNLMKARINLVIREPFFGTLALRLNLVEDSKCKTTWTDGRSLGYNPAIEELPMSQLEAIWAHHILTCAFGHPLRRGARDSKTWNEASDYAVNAELKQSGFDLPPHSKFDPRFHGMTAESIYSQLKAEEAPQEGSGKGPQGNPGQSTPGSSQGRPGDAEGQPQSSNEKPESATGEVRDLPAASEAERAEEEREWQVATTQAIQASKGAGKDPGETGIRLQAALVPKVAWNETLQRLIQARAKSDYSWSRPNRRLLGQGIYTPSLDAPSCGTLAFAVDVSGSTTATHRAQFLAEVFEAAAVLKPERTIVLLFDTHVRSIVELQDDVPFTIETKGNGGTKFDGPVLKLNEMDVRPEVLIYLTDLDSSVFPEEPDYPVVWVSTRKEKAPFGEVILMN